MKSHSPRNMAISFAGTTFPGYGGSEITTDGQEPMPLHIVFKHTSRKARQKFLAAKARELGTSIRGVKRFYGNGASITIPECHITRNSGGRLEVAWGDLELSMQLRKTHVPELKEA